MATNANEIFQVLLESLKVQADKYKIIIDADITHEQRKDLDTEIKQMYELLSQMTNSTIVLSSSEIESLITQFQTKLQEIQLILDDPNITTVKGDDGKSSYELALINGFVGSLTLWLESLKGETGSPGLQGIQGEKGDTGSQGPQGIQGEKGETGSQGLQGIQGEKGETGSQGPQGIQGEKGETGSQGPQGIQGEKGETGSQGPQGIQGEKGNIGLQGIQGERGDSGPTGLVGPAFTFDMFTPEQLNQIANLVVIPDTYLSDLTSRVSKLENLLFHPTASPFFYGSDPIVPKVSFVVDSVTDASVYTIEAGYFTTSPSRNIITQYSFGEPTMIHEVDAYIWDGKTSVDNVNDGYRVKASVSNDGSTVSYEVYEILNGSENLIHNITDMSGFVSFYNSPDVFVVNQTTVNANDKLGIKELLTFGSNYNLDNYNFVYYKESFKNSVTPSNMLGENLNSVESLVITAVVG